MTFDVRNMAHADVPLHTDHQSHHLAGRQHGHEDPFDEAGFRTCYCDGPEVSNVVLHNGRILGFQAVFEVESGVYFIGPFADQQTPVKGAGAAMFAKTQEKCWALLHK